MTSVLFTNGFNKTDSYHMRIINCYTNLQRNDVPWVCVNAPMYAYATWFYSPYSSIYHTALGPAHRYTRLRSRLAALIWNPHIQRFGGFELTLDSPLNHLQRISPESNDIDPCSWPEPSRCCNIYAANSRSSMWFIFRNIHIVFVKRFRDFVPIIIPCKCARQPKHSLFCEPIW